jgi:hypothetical protein
MAAQDWADMAMHELTACSLADPAVVDPATPGGASEGAITLHTLIARVARWQLARGADARQASAQWRQAATLVLRRSLHDADDIRQHAAMVNEVQHARQLCEQVETPEQANLLASVAQHDQARGNYGLAHAAWKTVVAHLERVLGSEHPATLTSMNNLATTLRAMGDLTGARTMQEQVLSIHQRVLGPEHPDTLISMGNLAGTLRAMGDLPGARATQEQVLAIHQRVLGAEHPRHLISMGNLAGYPASHGRSARRADHARAGIGHSSTCAGRRALRHLDQREQPGRLPCKPWAIFTAHGPCRRRHWPFINVYWAPSTPTPRSAWATWPAPCEPWAICLAHEPCRSRYWPFINVCWAPSIPQP